MKKFTTTAFGLLLSLLTVKAQDAPKDTTKTAFYFVGSVYQDKTDITFAVSDGLLEAGLQRLPTQIALIANKDFTKAYYSIYDANNNLIKTGRFIKAKQGQFDLVNVYTSHPETCRVEFSITPVTVKLL